MNLNLVEMAIDWYRQKTEKGVFLIYFHPFPQDMHANNRPRQSLVKKVKDHA